MRPPRLSLAGERPPLVAVAHGSRDPRAAATVSELLSVVRSRTDAPADVALAYLGHCAPSLPQVLDSRDAALDGDDRVVVVPLLLTCAYHAKIDIPAQLAAARVRDVRCGDTLGPHPLLLAALERRLREAGTAVDSAADRAATSVVLAAAGSSDQAANATIADLAAAWQRDRGWRAVVPAYASATAPSPGEAVYGLLDDGAPRVAVATYLLAPGYFADKIRAAAVLAGASAVSEALGAAPEVADVILARYADARRPGRIWPEPGNTERTVATPPLATCPIRGNRRGTDLSARAPRRE